MKALVLMLGVLFAVSAAAQGPPWFPRYHGAGPNSNTPIKAADLTAKGVLLHVKNITLGGKAVHFYDLGMSQQYVINFTKVCYGTVKNTWTTVVEKPKAPYVCVWDRLSPDQKTQIKALNIQMLMFH